MERRTDDAPATAAERRATPSLTRAWLFRVPAQFAGPDPYAKLGNTLSRWYDLNTPDIMM
ncbi:hypothetical protein KBD61_02595 [Patescibacteria group bacterium]|nr:hypothetical protein [Patescibacteria group bacterium]MBP9709895.1 hypothetical protein [Patescibacteria group bacterium]